jgi:Fic family protein
VETDENDLTYFILYHLDVIRRALGELREFIRKETQRLRELERQLRGISALNHRQRALISHALRHPDHRYTIESHRVSQNVVYETARSDLLDLRDRGLMRAEKVGRTWHFTPVADLEQRLAG